MARIIESIGKVRGRSTAELRTRGAQLFHLFAERSGISSLARVPSDHEFFSLIDTKVLRTRPPSAEALLTHFRTRTTPRFFKSFDEKEHTAVELRRRFGTKGKAVVDRAQAIVEGRFDLLGLRELDFGNPIDWHFDPVSGKHSPRMHWSHIPYLDAEQVGDSKVIWELNRQQYLATLGRAYWYTGNEAYGQTAFSHIHSWIEANPPKIGINWASSLEVAFRAISWLWAIYFFRDSVNCESNTFLQILKSLYVHGRHLETYLSTYFSPNTHLTGEALGLFYLGTLLPELSCAERWRKKGEEILLQQLDTHVLPDGVYFEQSSYYHRYTADFYTHLLILARQNDEPANKHLEEKLAALLDHLMYITRPDGSSPLFGDDDGGRLIKLDETAADDFRCTLATAAVLFNRGDYKYVAAEATEETLWLLGCEGFQRFEQLQVHPPEHRSRAYPTGGYYVMRDSWSPDANYMLLDCGPHGALKCGHAHADVLGFDAAVFGRTLLVDPGTYTYTGSVEQRDYFRSSPAHNTLTVDGQSSSEASSVFAWQHVAKAQRLSWISRTRFDFFEGKHDGYERLTAPVDHTRSVLFLKRDYWVIRDRLATAGKHRYDLHFNFSPEASPNVKLGSQISSLRERPHDSAGVEIFAAGNGGHWVEQPGWVSRCYGQRAPAPHYSWETEAQGDHEVISFVIPRCAGDDESQVIECKVTEGKAFEILTGMNRDILLLGNGSVLEVGSISFDFQIVWLRFNEEVNQLEEFVCVGGQQLVFDGRDIFRSQEFMAFAVAARVGNEFRGETDTINQWRSPIDVKNLDFRSFEFAAQ